MHRHSGVSFEQGNRLKTMEDKIIKIGIPKGSLQEHTFAIFKLAGFNIKISGKSYILDMEDKQFKGFLLRPQEIPRYVEQGKLDAGISGQDWITENKAKIQEICDLKYAKQKTKNIRWVLAVAKDSNINLIKDLQNKVVSTEIVNIAKDYFKSKKVKAKVEFSFGATEVKPPLFSDAIIDLVETGSALKAHNLKVLDTVFESSTKLIANKKSLKDKWKKEKIQGLGILLSGSVESEKTVGIFLHAPKKDIEKISKIIPCSNKLSARKIAGDDFYDIFFSVSLEKTRTLIPELKRQGCQDIVEFPLIKTIA